MKDWKKQAAAVLAVSLAAAVPGTALAAEARVRPRLPQGRRSVGDGRRGSLDRQEQPEHLLRQVRHDAAGFSVLRLWPRLAGLSRREREDTVAPPEVRRYVKFTSKF